MRLLFLGELNFLADYQLRAGCKILGTLFLCFFSVFQQHTCFGKDIKQYASRKHLRTHSRVEQNLPKYTVGSSATARI